MCYNKELCEKLMSTAEFRLNAHAKEIDDLRSGQVTLFGKIDLLVSHIANTNKLLWWVVGIFGTISTGSLIALIGVVLK